MRRLSTQILVFQVLIVAGTLVVGLALAFRGEQSRVDDEYERRALGVAQSVAAVPEIAHAIASADQSGTVQRRAEAIRRSSGMAFVVVTDIDGIRYSHPNPGRIGERVSTDPTEALAGNTVLVVETGTLGRSARAKVPLRAADGTIVGAVSVGILEGALHREIADLVPAMAIYLIVALALGIGASLLLARRLKRQTFGLELDEVAALVQEREAMLHGIREGVVIVDPEERLLLVNDEARRLRRPGLVGRRRAARRGGRSGAAGRRHRRPRERQRPPARPRRARDHRQPHDGAPRRPQLGAIVTLRDRTELESLVRELDSVRSLTDAMRAQAHEFRNRLHTLAGMLAMGHHDDATRFIAEVTNTDEKLRLQLGERIADPRLGALLLAKSAVASERGVVLELSEDSRLDHELVDAREGLTILGNLVDNALDAAAAGEADPRSFACTSPTRRARCWCGSAIAARACPPLSAR